MNQIWDRQVTLFNPRELGGSLSKVASDVMNMEGREIVSHWFHSPMEVDVFLWLDGRGNLIKQQMAWWGQVVEWNIVEGTKTGMVEEELSATYQETHEKMGSQLIKFDEQLQHKSIEQAIDILKYARVITESLRLQIQQNFSESPTIMTLEPSEFLRRYAQSAPGVKSGRLSQESIWGRILNQWRKLSRWR